ISMTSQGIANLLGSAASSGGVEPTLGRVASSVMRWVGVGVVAAAATLLTACSGSTSEVASTTQSPEPTTSVAAAPEPVSAPAPVAGCDQTFLARLSPRQKLAQLLTVGV